jgi:hypothetical protein
MTGKMMLATAWMTTDLAEFVCGKGFVGKMLKQCSKIDIEVRSLVSHHTRAVYQKE